MDVIQRDKKKKQNWKTLKNKKEQPQNKHFTVIKKNKAFAEN